MNRIALLTCLGLSAMLAANAQAATDHIIHDTEFLILEAQNGEQWAKDDEIIDAKLDAFR